MIFLLPLAVAQPPATDVPALTPDTAAPSEPTTAATRPRSGSAFDRPFALASYGAFRTGAYDSGGVGGRIRWEPTKAFGLDLYLEVAFPESEGGFRHDYPNGFSVYAALPVGPVRVRPFLGFCDVVSLVEPAQPDAPRADDLLVGVHGGLGTEVSLSPALSLFVDGQVDLYAGHDRSSGGWTGDVGEYLQPTLTGQVNAGLQLHIAELW